MTGDDDIDTSDARVDVEVGAVAVLLYALGCRPSSSSPPIGSLEMDMRLAFPLVDMLFGTYRRPRGFPAALGLAAPATSSTGARGTTG